MVIVNARSYIFTPAFNALKKNIKEKPRWLTISLLWHHLFLLFQVPYELLNKKFRIAQKNIDREVSHVQNAASELEKLLQRGIATVGEVTMALSGLEEKLTMLKRKVVTVFSMISFQMNYKWMNSCPEWIMDLKKLKRFNFVYPNQSTNQIDYSKPFVNQKKKVFIKVTTSWNWEVWMMTREYSFIDSRQSYKLTQSSVCLQVFYLYYISINCVIFQLQIVNWNFTCNPWKFKFYEINIS